MAATKNGKWQGVPIPNLKAVRMDLGLTQKELAFRVGCSHSMISLLEAGRCGASRRLVAEITAVIRDELVLRRTA